MGKHYIFATRYLTAGQIATICDRNPRHPISIELKELIDQFSADRYLTPATARIQAIEQNREFKIVETKVGSTIEVRMELGDELGTKPQHSFGHPGDSSDDVATIDDDVGGGGCC